MAKDNGGAAFPLKEALTSDNEGMTLRDYFAAKAMQSLISMFEQSDDAASIARIAYKTADLMLAERSKP